MSSQIDPMSRDYVVTDVGNLTRASAHRNAVLIALATEKGSVPGESDIGSELYTLTASKQTAELVTRAIDLARTALRPLETEGIITVLDVGAELVAGQLRLQVDYQAGSESHFFEYFIRVN